MTVVDRLNVAEDDRNKAVWADVLRKNYKAKICWSSTTGAGRNHCFRRCDKSLTTKDTKVHEGFGPCKGREPKVSFVHLGVLGG